MGRSRWIRAVVLPILAGLVALGPVVVPATPSAAANAASLSELKAQAIYYLRTGDEARRALVLDAMAARSPWRAGLWREFLASWETINNGLKMNTTVPKGLPSKGHVFVVLGSALTKSGKMSTKLERRMELALAALRKYPRSAVLVSGGAPRNGQTEAAVMYRWLVAHDVAKSRILVEEKSPSTVGNASYSMTMLAGMPKFTSYSLISDSSHLRRTSILFRAATVGVQERTGKAWPIRQLANVAHLDMASAGRSALSSSSIAYTASNVASVLKVLPAYKDVVDDPPPAPVLTALSLKAPAKLTYEVGEELDPRGMVVTAVYNKGVYSRLVTDDAAVTGFDSGAVGKGRAVTSFSDGGVTKASTFSYSVVKAAGALGWRLSTRSITRGKTRVRVAATVTAPHGLVPSGRVRYYLDGKRLKTVALNSRAGTVSFTYPRIATAGAHRFVVTYSGDGRLQAARKAVTLKVKG